MRGETFQPGLHDWVAVNRVVLDVTENSGAAARRLKHKLRTITGRGSGFCIARRGPPPDSLAGYRTTNP